MIKKLFLFLIILILFSFPKNTWAAASFSFSPASKTVTLNESFAVDVILSTGGAETDGADAIVKYDGNKLQVISAKLGSLYANKLIEDTSTPGKIVLRATTTAETSYNGTGTFATLTFKAIAEGTANLYFDFTSGSTTDSNVAYKGSDLLGSVANASYTITSAAAPPGASPGVGGPSPSPSVPISGWSAPTIFLLAGGLLLLLMGSLKFFFI